eukprot:1158513-Pelagomonas_calceolata.AAC.10
MPDVRMSGFNNVIYVMLELNEQQQMSCSRAVYLHGSPVHCIFTALQCQKYGQLLRSSAWDMLCSITCVFEGSASHIPRVPHPSPAHQCQHATERAQPARRVPHAQPSLDRKGGKVYPAFNA